MFEQQSFDWHTWRKEGIGASDAPIIMGISPYKTPYQLWEEKLDLSEEKTGSNFVQQKGLEYEKRSQALYTLETGIDVEPMLVQWSEHPVLRASLDGYNEQKKIIFEAKFVGEETFLKGEVVPHHMPQLQHQLVCTDAERVDYVLYSEKQDKIKIIPVLPDPLYHCELVEKELKFWSLVRTQTPPELTDKDFKKVKSEEIESLVSALKDTQKQIKSLGDLEKELKDRITSHEMIKSHRRIALGNAKIIKILRKGNVDYSLVPQLEGVDLEPYRKRPTEYWSIK